MNPIQQRHVDILSRLAADTLTPSGAAALLGVSVRHVRRLRRQFATTGVAAVVHGNQGRSPANRTDPALLARIISLAGPGGTYADCNVCHLQDLLDEREQITIARSTLDRLLKQAGLRVPARAASPVHRRRRTRATAAGMLLQIDGSAHAWLEARGPRCTLLGACDDATGTVLYAHFRPTEDQVGYFLLIRTIALIHGLPLAYYHDRHTILRSPKAPTLEDELAGTLPQSQIQRLLAELGVESIPAHSPQAKGRIERLWGTFQDRLVLELRFAGITTIADANAFLPAFLARYNARFARPPADPASAWVPLPVDCDLAYYFASRESRKVRADNCVPWLGQLLQLLPEPGQPNLVRQSVQIHRLPEGDLAVYHGRRRVPHRPVAPSPPQPPAEAPPPAPRRSPASAGAAQRRWLFGNH